MNNNQGVCTELVIRTVKKTITDNSLIKKGDKILVALSGGADSVCLLHVLSTLKEELKINVAAAHLNHMIRGREADSDEAYAAELCTKLGIHFYAERVDVPLISKRDGISEELAGRQERYAFFERLCKKHSFTKTATAHNRNDRAETVLMRVIRGTGIDGLCSIKYKRDDNVIRPLLDVKREDIENYCAENSLKYCTDSTNAETIYTRNKIRAELIPFIEKNFNPKVIDSLCSLAENSTEDAAFINGYAERLYDRINSPMPKRKPTVLDIESLKMVGESIQNRLLRIAAKEVMGDGYNMERCHIDAIRAIFRSETGATVQLPMGLRVSVKYGWLEFKIEDDTERESVNFCYEIDVNGEVQICDLNISFMVMEGKPTLQKNQIVLDFDKICDKPLFVRNRRAGDRMVFFKDGKSRKLKDYWIDKKVPSEDRDSIPLLCTKDEVIAIIGDRVAENIKMTESSTRGLVITYGTNDESR